MTTHVLTGVAVEDMRSGDVVEMTVGPRTVVRRVGGNDLHARLAARAKHARQVRRGWNQDDRYPETVAPRDLDELLHLAWTIIANAGVHQGGWEEQHPDWVQAAIRWRNAYFDTLPATVPAVPVSPVEPAAPARAEVTQISEDEFRTAADRALARLGLTLPELAEMAGRDDFVSLSAKKLWLALGAMG